MFFTFYENEIKFVYKYIYSYFFLAVTVSGKGENGKTLIVSLSVESFVTVYFLPNGVNTWGFVFLKKECL